MAARFKVLADALRLRILHTLQDSEMSVTAITTAVGATQPNVSKHLKILQEAGFLARRQDGNTVYYAIADASVFELCDVVCSRLYAHFTTHASTFAAPAVPAPRRRQ